MTREEKTQNQLENIMFEKVNFEDMKNEPCLELVVLGNGEESFLEEITRRRAKRQIAVFSEIKKIEKEYKDFLKQLRKRKVKIKENAFSVIYFLFYKDYLKVDNKEDSEVQNG